MQTWFFAAQNQHANHYTTLGQFNILRLTAVLHKMGFMLRIPAFLNIKKQHCCLHFRTFLWGIDIMDFWTSKSGTIFVGGSWQGCEFCHFSFPVSGSLFSGFRQCCRCNCVFCFVWKETFERDIFDMYTVFPMCYNQLNPIVSKST